MVGLIIHIYKKKYVFRFRAKMAKSTPTDVLIKKKVKEGLSEKEKADYRATFR